MATLVTSFIDSLAKCTIGKIVGLWIYKQQKNGVMKYKQHFSKDHNESDDSRIKSVVTESAE